MSGKQCNVDLDQTPLSVHVCSGSAVFVNVTGKKEKVSQENTRTPSSDSEKHTNTLE